MKRLIVFLLMLSFISLTYCFGERYVLQFKDGNVIEGNIVSQDDVMITIKLDSDKNISYYKVLLNTLEPSTGYHTRLGDDSYKARKYADAVKEYEKVLQIDPQNDHAQKQIAAINKRYASQHKEQQAKQNEIADALLFSQGMSYYRSMNYELAASKFKEALTYNANDSSAAEYLKLSTQKASETEPQSVQDEEKLMQSEKTETVKQPELNAVVANNTPPPAPTETISDVQKVVTGNTAFALNLYSELKTTGGNLFFSPYSLSMALAMTYGGARGQTAEQMARVLQFPTLPNNKLHAAFGALKARMDSIQKGGTVQLNIANALWPQKGYPFLNKYLNLLKSQYGGSVTPLDYKENKEAACQAINHWVEEQTQHKITDLIQPGSLNSLTRLVLANAIYFKGQWATPFNPNATVKDTFHQTVIKDVPCQMMKKQETFAYTETPDLQIVELPYAGKELSMVILLPRTVDGIGTLENSLSAKKLTEWFGSLKKKTVMVHLPKFLQTSTFNLAEILEKMGMTLAFDNKADFSGMNGHTNDLFIGVVRHKAYVDINEKGTEAAAATAITMRMSARLGEREVPIPVFRADHPFIFLIVDKNTSSILFMGRVNEPKT